MPFIAAKSLMLVRYTPARATASKLLPAALRTAERFWKTRSVSATIPPATTLPVAGSWATLSAEVEETTDFDRLGKRADRRRELRRGNCSLAHGKLLWILVSWSG